MGYRIRYLVLLLFDAVLITLAVYVMLLLRFDAAIPLEFKDAFHELIPIIILINLLFLTGMKLYNRIWEYASLGELFAILRATTFSMAVIVMLIYLFKLPILPRSVYIGSWVFISIFIGASRVSWRVLRNFFFQGQTGDFQSVLVIGAGDAGAILVKEIGNNPRLKMKVKGIVDDDPSRQGMILHNVPILGTRKKIETLVPDLEIDEIIIAIPSANGETIRQLVNICKKTTARLRILPGIYQSASGLVKNLRDVQMEDLLRREPVQVNLAEIAGYINNKTILVTGAGGSIGSELCRQLANLSPSNLVILDCCENNLFDIESELKADYPDVSILSKLIDIRKEDKLEKVFLDYRPQVVFHAAAYKHVPMMERHPDEAIENNVIGSFISAKLADRYKVETFIFISTDKAVNPTSVMGTSKRIAELIIKDIDYASKTRFASVRFGNVLGSRGSVIPTFVRQIERGGPVTVTHPDMQRYFMTIPEAVQLVIQAGALTQGGEIFVLDMGEMVKIDDLARDLIRLAGFDSDNDIQIVYTGIRPGEKLYEELFTNQEGMMTTQHERIFVLSKEVNGDLEKMCSHFYSLINESGSSNSRLYDIRSLLESRISDSEQKRESC
ncbi:MAG: nucleoside-diphosphate sugar epimerase/dehydratase [Syntrophomonas sp.]